MRDDLLDTISFSQAATLAGCEWKWFWRYMLDGEDAPSTAMRLGSYMHLLAREWWGDTAVDYSDVDVDDETVAKADWLLDRYMQHYHALRDETKVLAHEVELEMPVPAAGATLRGFLDGIYEIGGMRWAVERKTYSSRNRLDTLSVDPQITLYTALAQHNGYNVDGVLWDGIYTYQWKGERPVSESFDLIYLDRTQEQIDLALNEWLVPIAQRRAELASGQADPVRDFGWHCKTCPARAACHEAMAFGLTVVAE